MKTPKLILLAGAVLALTGTTVMAQSTVMNYTFDGLTDLPGDVTVDAQSFSGTVSGSVVGDQAVTITSMTWNNAWYRFFTSFDGAGLKADIASNPSPSLSDYSVSVDFQNHVKNAPQSLPNGGFLIVRAYNAGLTEIVRLEGTLLSLASGLTTNSFAFDTMTAKDGTGTAADFFTADSYTVEISIAASQGGFAYNGGPHSMIIDNLTVTAVPEPGTFALILGGLGLLLVAVRRRRS